MKFVKGLIFKVVAVTLFLLVLLAAADNSEVVALTFLEFRTPELPLFWWVLLAFVGGVAFSTLLNTWANANLRLEARKARSKVDKTNQTLDKALAENSPDPNLNSQA